MYGQCNKVARNESSSIPCNMLHCLSCPYIWEFVATKLHCDAGLFSPQPHIELSVEATNGELIDTSAYNIECRYYTTERNLM